MKLKSDSEVMFQTSAGINIGLNLHIVSNDCGVQIELLERIRLARRWRRAAKTGIHHREDDEI